MLFILKRLPQVLRGFFIVLSLQNAHAGIFDDDEARKAILDLRTRVDQNRQAADAQNAELKRAQEAQAKSSEKSLEDSNAALRRSLLDLQNQIEALRGEIARLRGQDEQLAKDVAELQRRQKDLAQGVDERVRKFEPTKVSIDGREFNAEPNEKRDFEAAFAAFRKPDFNAATSAFQDFLRRYGQSGYVPSAYFWLGNSQYANRDYQGAISNFRNLIGIAADHPKASEAALSIANCQLELKDSRAAKKTLEDLIKVYPNSEAAVAAKERLARIK